MDLNTLKEKVKEFEEKAGFDKTKFLDLMKMLDEEINILKTCADDKTVVDHQLTDILILVMQIAQRYDTNFEKELEKWFEKSKKYIEK